MTGTDEIIKAMTFTDYLKIQLTDFVECYRKFFWRTLGTAMTYTVICFLFMAILLKFSNFEVNSGRQVSLLSYFFSKYSAGDTYSLIDCSKTVFLFFVSLFSVGLFRLDSNETAEQKELSFSSFIKKLHGFDLLFFSGVLILCSAIDYGLFRFGTIYATATSNYDLRRWIDAFLLLLRNYIPLLIFSFAVYKDTFERWIKISSRKIIFLFVSLWLFNAFAYEISLLIRLYIFPLLLAPFGEDNKFFYESFLGIPLVAFYFVGYHSALTLMPKHLNEKWAEAETDKNQKRPPISSESVLDS